MKYSIVLNFLLIITCTVNAQQKQYDFSKVNYLQPQLYEVRINPNDTVFKHAKFIMPPSFIIAKPGIPFKTKAEGDSLVALINYIQQKIIDTSKPKTISKQ